MKFNADGSVDFSDAIIRGPELPAHQLRVLEELTELEGRASKLQVFLHSERATSLDDAELSLMRTQDRVMRDLANILRARLALWGVKP